MTTSTARRHDRSRPKPPSRSARDLAEGKAVGIEAHASHLKRAAQSAGEAFAWTADEPAPRARGYGSTAIWVTAGAVAALGLYVAF
ncbi:hypothetical protein [Salinarimonas sp.]|uniref:hypothetical protein n=1 Tax=Salinarimonas sp. TaxID=2766526 RepID=UPI0032D8EC03